MIAILLSALLRHVVEDKPHILIRNRCSYSHVTHNCRYHARRELVRCRMAASAIIAKSFFAFQSHGGWVLIAKYCFGWCASFALLWCDGPKSRYQYRNSRQNDDVLSHCPPALPSGTAKRQAMPKTQTFQLCLP